MEARRVVITSITASWPISAISKSVSNSSNIESRVFEAAIIFPPFFTSNSSMSTLKEDGSLDTRVRPVVLFIRSYEGVSFSSWDCSDVAITASLSAFFRAFLSRGALNGSSGKSSTNSSHFSSTSS